ncbi:hypothetical protein H5410_038406 [Solanum commersonii]|uniref:Uncharacterized protein n=1 Tax=Solanum commersonii TaxID=4109 RepID=A0A9J5YDV6_SOLCO|nr:hypothetical protein H5410_038406 [Solanum commersonii]
MANFEQNVMVALYLGGEIITEMNEFSGQHGFHMNLLAQNYGFATISQPHFAELIIPPSFQQLSTRDHRPFVEGSSSQRHFDSSHREYKASDENLEEDEPSKDDDESEPDEDIIDIRDFSQNDIDINHSNRCEQDVPEMQNHDVPYFRTLEIEEDIFMSTCESEMEHCSVWSEDTQKDLKKYKESKEA